MKPREKRRMSNVNFDPSAHTGNFQSPARSGKPPIKKGFVVRREDDNEMRLFFRLEGTIDPNDAVVVFVHGVGSDSRIWRAIDLNYTAFAQQFAGTLVFPEECKGIQSLRDYSVKTILNVPQAVFLQ